MYACQFLLTFKLVAAEYLAKGYILSDHILQRAIEMDSESILFTFYPSPNISKLLRDKQGISKRFLSYFHNLDKSVGERALGHDQTISGKIQSTVGKAVQHAKTADKEKGYLKMVHDVSFSFYTFKLLRNERVILFSLKKQYYLKAISSPLGQRVRAFYTQSSKQVQDIHEEARRIADHEKNEKSSANDSSSKQTTQGASTGSASEFASESKEYSH